MYGGFNFLCSVCNQIAKTLYLFHALQHSKQANFEIIGGLKIVILFQILFVLESH